MAKPKKVRQRAKRDANHNELVRVLPALGAGWLELSQLPGALDGIVGVCGIDQRVEIKDGGKPPSERKLTPAEKEVFEIWPGRKPVVIETVNQMIDLVNNLRQEGLGNVRNNKN